MQNTDKKDKKDHKQTKNVKNGDKDVKREEKTDLLQPEVTEDRINYKQNDDLEKEDVKKEANIVNLQSKYMKKKDSTKNLQLNQIKNEDESELGQLTNNEVGKIISFQLQHLVEKKAFMANQNKNDQLGSQQPNDKCKKSHVQYAQGSIEDNRNLDQPTEVQSDHDSDAPPTRTLKGIAAKKTDLYKL